MKTRLITAGVLIPLLFVVVLWMPEIVTAIILGAIVAIAAYEMLFVTNLVKHTRLVIYAMVMAFLVTLWGFFGKNEAAGILGLVAFVALLFAEMMRDHIKLNFEMLTVVVCAGVLVPYFLSSIVQVHTMRLGRYFIMIPFIMAFGPDAGAYFAGRAFGQHKLAPVISPNKTVEGMIGGLLTGMLMMVIYTLILQLGFSMKVNYMYALIYGIVGSLGATFGDLCFSVIKRQTGIKDYGNLIPGHGGVLDRFDSMLVVAPLTEILITLIPVV